MGKIIFLFFGLALLGHSNSAFAVTELSISETNPSSVSATVAVRCEEAANLLEKRFEQFFVGVPYVKQVSKVSETAFRDGEKDSTYLNSLRELYFSLDSNIPKEFPMTLTTLNVERRICKETKIPSTETECKDRWSYTLDGAKAVTYQKSVALGKKQNIWKSFNVSLTLTKATAASCTFTSQLTVNDSQYIWAKKHLLGQSEPAQLEKAIHKAFTKWGSALATKLEGNL